MNERLHFVDANVPMYAVGAPHHLKAPCLSVLHASGTGDLATITDSEVLQEILHRYSSVGQRRTAGDVMRLFVQAVPDVLAVTKADVELAAEILFDHAALRARDAVHLAVMQRNGIALIISADRHFDVVPGLTRIDPAQWSA